MYVKIVRFLCTLALFVLMRCLSPQAIQINISLQIIWTNFKAALEQGDTDKAIRLFMALKGENERVKGEKKKMKMLLTPFLHLVPLPGSVNR